MAARVEGANYRQIANQLNVSVGTAFDDVAAELEAVCQSTAQEAERLRDLELERMDRILRVLDAAIESGDVPACRAAIRVSMHRARLLGLFRVADSSVDQGLYAELSERELVFRVEKLVEHAKKIHAADAKAKKGTVH